MPEKPMVLAFELLDADAAQELAEDIARRTGKTIVVKDAWGNDICTVSPPGRPDHRPKDMPPLLVRRSGKRFDLS